MLDADERRAAIEAIADKAEAAEKTGETKWSDDFHTVSAVEKKRRLDMAKQIASE